VSIIRRPIFYQVNNSQEVQTTSVLGVLKFRMPSGVILKDGEAFVKD
jgi:hypothetical protein